MTEVKVRNPIKIWKVLTILGVPFFTKVKWTIHSLVKPTIIKYDGDKE